jgi:hypothetical protein
VVSSAFKAASTSKLATAGALVAAGAEVGWLVGAAGVQAPNTMPIMKRLAITSDSVLLLYMAKTPSSFYQSKMGLGKG